MLDDDKIKQILTDKFKDFELNPPQHVRKNVFSHLLSKQLLKSAGIITLSVVVVGLITFVIWTHSGEEKNPLPSQEEAISSSSEKQRDSEITMIQAQTNSTANLNPTLSSAQVNPESITAVNKEQVAENLTKGSIEGEKRTDPQSENPIKMVSETVSEDNKLAAIENPFGEQNSRSSKFKKEENKALSQPKSSFMPGFREHELPAIASTNNSSLLFSLTPVIIQQAFTLLKSDPELALNLHHQPDLGTLSNSPVLPGHFYAALVGQLNTAINRNDSIDLNQLFGVDLNLQYESTKGFLYNIGLGYGQQQISYNSYSSYDSLLNIVDTRYEYDTTIVQKIDTLGMDTFGVWILTAADYEMIDSTLIVENRDSILRITKSERKAVPLSYVSLPIQLGKRFSYGRHQLAIQAGVTLKFLTNGKNLNITNASSIVPSKFYLDYTGQLTYGFLLTPRLAFNLGLRYAFIQQQRLYSNSLSYHVFGGTAGLTFRLR